MSHDEKFESKDFRRFSPSKSFDSQTFDGNHSSSGFYPIFLSLKRQVGHQALDNSKAGLLVFDSITRCATIYVLTF